MSEAPRRRRWPRPAGAVLILLAVLIVPHLIAAGLVYGGQFEHWSRARWDSAGLAPDPATAKEAIVQVYAARAWGWKGIFGVHTWLVTKPADAAAYTRYDVVGWGVRRGAPAVRTNMRAADGYWAGNPPELLLDRRGPDAARLIEAIERAIAAYPFDDRYITWPGPNSNSFVAHVARTVPELGLEMSPLAIGKDYLGSGILARTPSGTGWQLSLFGVLGFSLALAEGLELNVLGLTLGLDPDDLAIKLPGIGRLGLP